MFRSLTPGRLYHFRVRTEKETFTDSPAVTFNITAGTHLGHLGHFIQLDSPLLPLVQPPPFPLSPPLLSSPLLLPSAPSPVEVVVLSKTTTSVTLVWGTAGGLVSGYILSLKNQTSNQQLNLTSLEHRYMGGGGGGCTVILYAK